MGRRLALLVIYAFVFSLSYPPISCGSKTSAAQINSFHNRVQEYPSAINPLQGQYANYSNVKYYSNGTIEWVGWANYSYLEYVVSDIMNLTLLMERPEPPSGVYWALLNTTSRWINNSAVPGWTDSWYGYWIETDVSIGSIINFYKTNATVLGEERLFLFEKAINCWVVNYAEPGFEMLAFFDKKTGMFIEGISDFVGQFLMNLTLVSTNVPIGLQFLPIHNVNTGLNYTTIQAAINAPETLNGHTIFVEEGTYFEHVTVSKSIALLGENRETTVIDGNMTGNVVRITQDHVNIRGFTIQRSGQAFSNSGIHIGSTQHCDISSNYIVDNEFGVFGSPRSMSITDNIIEGNFLGVALESGATGNVISRNNLVANYVSVHLYLADANYILQNNMTNNWRSITLWISKNNTLYHNNFLNNTFGSVNYANFLDNGFEGNYWSNYTGVDLNHDGIGDSPYAIDPNNIDNYPLMGIFQSFNTSLGKYITVVSNSTIDDFEYFESNSTIRMYVSNATLNQAFGFCRMCIPHDLVFEPFNVTINGANPIHWNYTLFDNGTHRWIYFSYEHSAVEIVIVPEFRSLIILPLFLIATLMIAGMFRKRRLKS